MSIEEKVNYYDEANKEVAILCNHQKTIPKNFDYMLEKNNEKVPVSPFYYFFGEKLDLKFKKIIYIKSFSQKKQIKNS
jgi:DNA topoisomerase I